MATKKVNKKQKKKCFGNKTAKKKDEKNYLAN
jgi:hypothetical protein